MFSVYPLGIDEISGGITIIIYCQDVLAIKNKRNRLPSFIIGCTYSTYISCLIILVQIFFLKRSCRPNLNILKFQQIVLSFFFF